MEHDDDAYPCGIAPPGLANRSLAQDSEARHSIPYPHHRNVCSNGRMQFIETSLPGVKLVEPQIFSDDRGWFAEIFNQSAFTAAGLPGEFAQDNQSLSRRGVLRGLHYQLGRPQGKLVRAVSGHIFDVAVDLRRNSSQFGKWEGFHLTSDKLQLLWIPEGFAHGFLVLSDTATVLYKATDLYHPPGERCIRWDDPDLDIAWPDLLDSTGASAPAKPLVSPKDALGSLFAEAELPPVGPLP